MMRRETIIAELQRVAKTLHTDCLSRSAFQKHATLSSSGVERVFGSWNEAIVAAGLTPLPSGGIPKNEQRRLERITDPPAGGIDAGHTPDDVLLDELMRVAKRLGRPPSGNQLAAKGKYDPSVYRKRWGSVAQAYEVAASRWHSRGLT